MRKLILTAFLLLSFLYAEDKKNIFVGVNGYISSLEHELCGNCERDNSVRNMGLEIGYKYTKDTLLSLEYDFVNWDNADLDMYSFSYEHLYDEIKRDDYTIFTGVDVGLARFENSVDSDTGIALGLKAGVLYPLSLKNDLYVEGIVKYKRFFGVETNTSGNCNGMQELKSLTSIGVGLNWFF